jgi:hypothetical protein
MTRLSILLILQLLCLGAGAQESMQAPEFKAGQRWSYDTRPGETESTLIIGRVEDLPSIGTVIHISVVDVTISSGQGESTHVIHHMPIAPDALRKSVVSHLGNASLPEHFEDGYASWRKAGGGIFTITVREALEYIQQTIIKGK